MAAEAALRWRDDDEGMGRAIALAIGLHLLLAALFWVFSLLDLSRKVPAAAGQPVISADLDVSDAEAAAAREALAYQPEPLPPEPVPEPVEEEAVPPPQPVPEPVPDEAPVEQQRQAQERVPVSDTEQQEEVRRDAISEEVREREQEEKRRQEQIDLTEQERQREAEQRQRLARQQEDLKKKQERDRKLAQIRAERARLQKQTQMSEQRLRQLADARAQAASEAAAQSDRSGSPPAGNGGVDQGLLNQYIAAITAAVTSKWTRPENMPNLPCRMTIVQLPGGEVMSVEFSGSCPYDEAGKRSVEAAVLKAQPLPYAGFEPVFNRRLNFTFRPSN